MDLICVLAKRSNITPVKRGGVKIKKKLEREIKYRMRESVALKKNKIRIEGKTYEIGDRIIHIGEVIAVEGDPPQEPPLESEYPGTIMSKTKRLNLYPIPDPIPDPIKTM